MKCVLALLALIFSASAAFAQPLPQPARMGIDKSINPEVVSVLNGNGIWSPIGSVDTSTNIFTPVSGSGSSFASWVPNSTYLNVPVVSTVSANGLLPAAPTVLVTNNGAFPIIVKFTNNPAGTVTPSTADDRIPGGATHALGTTGFTNVAYAAVGGPSAMQMSGGDGLFAGAGGGSTGGGGGSGGGPLGAQPTINSQSVNPATDAVWPTVYGHNTVVTGNITLADSITSCASTLPPVQTLCSGTPTAGSVLQTTASDAGNLVVSAVLTGGTLTSVSFTMEVSNDGLFWVGRGLFLDSNLAPGWQNGIGNAQFTGTAPGGMPFFRVRATTFVVATGTPSVAITITKAQATPFVYAGNVASAATGTVAKFANNIQGNCAIAGTTCLPVNIQGVPGGTPVPISGTVTASFSQFAPSGNYANLTAGAASTSVALPTGSPTTVKVDNVGAVAAFVNFGIGSATATLNQNQIAAGGFQCFAVGTNTFIAGITATSTAQLNISGGSGGCAGSGGGGGSSGGGGGGGTADSTIAGVNTISAADVAMTTTAGQNGSSLLVGTPTAGSTITFGGISGIQTAALQCTGAGLTGTNTFEVDATGPDLGTTWVRKTITDLRGGASPSSTKTFSLPFTGNINTAGMGGLMIRATTWVSGSPTCSLRATSNLAEVNVVNLLPAGKDAIINTSAVTTGTSLVAGVAGTSINVTAWEFMASGTTTFSIGTSASTSCTSIIPIPWDLVASNGQTMGSGISSIFTAPSGATLCFVNTAGVHVGGHVHYTQS